VRVEACCGVLIVRCVTRAFSFLSRFQYPPIDWYLPNSFSSRAAIQPPLINAEFGEETLIAKCEPTEELLANEGAPGGGRPNSAGTGGTVKSKWSDVFQRKVEPAHSLSPAPLAAATSAATGARRSSAEEEHKQPPLLQHARKDVVIVIDRDAHTQSPVSPLVAHPMQAAPSYGSHLVNGSSSSRPPSSAPSEFGGLRARANDHGYMRAPPVASISLAAINSAAGYTPAHIGLPAAFTPAPSPCRIPFSLDALTAGSRPIFM
jgi:hypothetical protein